MSAAGLIAEDGSVVADANSYCTVGFADEYHLLRQNEAWAGASEEEKEGALIRASDYLGTRWRFVGSRTDEDQTLEWPRDDATDINGFEQEDNVPVVVQQTVAEYALRSLSAPLLPDPTVDDNGKYVTLKREKVGPLEEETRYSDTKGRTLIQPYPAADRRLAASGLVLTSNGRVIHA